jgi:uncharacterized membrane protein
MEEMLKEIMGEAYKENMTSDEIQTFFKNQVLGSGNYVNKDAAEAEKRKLQNALDTANNELKNKMTDDEKKAAADQELQNQLEELKKQLAEGKVNNSQYKAMSLTSKGRTNAGIEENDKDFSEFIAAISTEDEAKTTKIASYVNTLIEKAYEKGKADITKNKLGGMGNFNTNSNSDGNNGKSEAEEIAERLAKGNATSVKQNTYFK